MEADSAAARAGLDAGDILLALDGVPVTGADDLIRVLTGDKIGRRLEVTILRNGTHEVSRSSRKSASGANNHHRGVRRLGPQASIGLCEIAFGDGLPGQGARNDGCADHIPPPSAKQYTAFGA